MSLADIQTLLKSPIGVEKNKHIRNIAFSGLKHITTVEFEES